MGFSWNYLTRRFLLQNYRDYIAMTMIGCYGGGYWLTMVTKGRDNDFVMQHIYTDDESDITFREATNKTDGAMKRKYAVAYAAKVNQLRAEKERAAQLDAFNFLHGTNLQL